MQIVEDYTSKDIKLLPVKKTDSILLSAETYFDGIEKLREEYGIPREEAAQITRELLEADPLKISLDYASALLRFWKSGDKKSSDDVALEEYLHTQKLLQRAYTETKPFWKVKGEVLTILQAESEAIFGNVLIANDQPLRGLQKFEAKEGDKVRYRNEIDRI